MNPTLETTQDNGPVWTTFAEHYDKVIPLTKCYRQLMSQIMELCANARSIIDAGCGTGLVTQKLLNGQRHIFGFDADPQMLAGAVRRREALTTKQQMEWTLCRGDVTAFPETTPKEADAVILNNVLFCVKEPLKALQESFRHLKKGGVIVVTGPQRRPNLDYLRDRTLQDMKEEGIYTPELHASLDLTIEFQKQVASPNEMPSVFTVPQLIQLLRDAGFTHVLAESDREYYGESFLVAMEK